MKYVFAGFALLTGFCVGAASASPFTEIRIGDIDGFDYGTADGRLSADGLAANLNGTRFLDNGDALPDLDGSGATNASDLFDNRTSPEVAVSLIGGGGFEVRGSAGSKYTDISLSDSYDQASTNGTVYNVNMDSVDPIDIEVPISQPMTALLLGLGLIGLGLRLRHT